MSGKKLDLLNIGLMLLAFVLAIKIPFELFLFAYAILGPLHYLTEINWLHHKQYFIQQRKWVYVLIGLSALICLAPLMDAVTKLTWFSSWRESIISLPLFTSLFAWSTNLLFLGFVSAIFFVRFKDYRKISIGILLTTGIAYLLMKKPLYITLVGVFLPTIFHVFLFTALFMLYGAIKGKSTLGIWSVALLFGLAFMISKLKITPSNYILSETTKQNFMYSTFANVHKGIIHFLHLSNPKKPLQILSVAGIKVQIFIAFAYTYHYLNWFSKTSIIGWHKIEKKKLILILFLWGTSVGLYFYHYKLGFMALLFLSMLHVFLEFPLNYVSIRGIIQHISPIKRAA